MPARRSGEAAFLVSPPFRFPAGSVSSRTGRGMVSFKYHMHGATIGTLTVQMRCAPVTAQRLLTHDRGGVSGTTASGGNEDITGTTPAAAGSGNYSAGDSSGSSTDAIGTCFGPTYSNWVGKEGWQDIAKLDSHQQRAEADPWFTTRCAMLPSTGPLQVPRLTDIAGAVCTRARAAVGYTQLHAAAVTAILCH
jgi:hypothetical protein